jgi:hypothetical protein
MAAGVPDDLLVGLEPADRVARGGLRALAAGEHSVISGLTNWLGVEVQRMVPRRLVTSAAEMRSAPGTAASPGRHVRSRVASAAASAAYDGADRARTGYLV